MAKSIVLYGVFLGAFICLCTGFTRSYLGTGNSVRGTRSLEPEDVLCTVNLLNKQVFRLNDINRGGIYQIEGLNCKSLGMRDSSYHAQSTNFMTRRVLQKIYTAEIGVREKTGKNDGPRVEEYLAVTNLGKGYAYCASFVSWVFSEAGFKEPRTPWSPALFPKSKVIWERGKSIVRTNTLKPIANPEFQIPNTADVFGIYFSNLKRIAHCGFIDEWGDKYAICVEGNTNEVGSAEGDGVYRKRRPISSIYQVANWIGKEGAK